MMSSRPSRFFHACSHARLSSVVQGQISLPSKTRRLWLRISMVEIFNMAFARADKRQHRFQTSTCASNDFSMRERNAAVDSQHCQRTIDRCSVRDCVDWNLVRITSREVGWRRGERANSGELSGIYSKFLYSCQQGCAIDAQPDRSSVSSTHASFACPEGEHDLIALFLGRLVEIFLAI